MKKKIYKWHRTCSLIIAVPVMLWAASGFMHPIMTNIRPKVATQWLMPAVVDSSKMRISLKEALLQNQIDSFAHVRLIQIDTNWFYQVQKENGKEPVYIATLTGKMLTAGDWLYAQYLAKQFLEGQQKSMPSKAAPPIAVQVSMPMNMPMAAHDCCDAAAEMVLNNTRGSKVADASFITSFNSEYKSINRLLPVYKVSFDRPDGIRIYVETTQDRFAFAMDNKRHIFDSIFTIVHTWAWLDFLGKGKLAVEFLLASLAFFTSLMGIYIFFTTKSKKVPGNELVKARRNHRYTSIAIALFTLMFTFSGAFHALSKFSDDTRDRYFANGRFACNAINCSFAQLQELAKSPITNISLVSISNRTYWQVNTKPAFERKGSIEPKRKDLMKDAQVPASSALYIADDDKTILPQGETLYANYLANLFSGNKDAAIISTTAITKFDNEYNFTDKRLPVWKISYSGSANERYYVETSTGRLSKSIAGNDLVESYSFAFLHKHEFMGWGGKSLKDFSTMFWALSQIVMVSVGLILYFKWRNRMNG